MKSDGSKKILCVAEAVTLAHVARILRVAEELSDSGFSVTLAFDQRYQRFMQLNLPYRHLPSIDPAVFTGRANSYQFPYTESELRSYLADEKALLDQIRPDLVISDFRLTLPISLHVAKIPHFSLTNGYWLPEFGLGPAIPDLPAFRPLPRFLARLAYAAARPIVYRINSAVFNRVAREAGAVAVQGTMLDIYTQGDMRLLADPPGWLDFSASPRDCFIGPMAWRAPVDNPAWWPQLDRKKKTIFVSVGSSGSEQAVAAVLAATDGLEVQGQAPQIVISGLELAPEYQQRSVFSAKFISNPAAMEISQLFISNGGSLSMVDAFRCAVPIIGITSNFDQLINATIIEDKGLGRRFLCRNVQPAELRSAIVQLLQPDLERDARLREAQALYSQPLQTGALISRIDAL